MTLADEVRAAGFTLEELTRQSSRDLRYEVHTRAGMHFASGEHSRVFYDAAEVRAFIRDTSATRTQPCTEDCDT